MTTQRKQDRQRRAYERFGRSFKHDRAGQDVAYTVRKAQEQFSLETSLGVTPTKGIVSFLAKHVLSFIPKRVRA